MSEADEALSRDVTEALNASVPETVKAADRGRIASSLILTAAFCAVAVGFGAAIFGSALAASSVGLALVLAVFALLIAVEVVALIIGIRAKRAFTRLAAAVRTEHQASLVRVVGRQVHVRR